jgi:hypothetical protein
VLLERLVGQKTAFTKAVTQAACHPVRKFRYLPRHRLGFIHRFAVRLKDRFRQDGGGLLDWSVKRSSSAKFTRATGTETPQQAIRSRSGDTMGTVHPTTPFTYSSLVLAQPRRRVSSRTFINASQSTMVVSVYFVRASARHSFSRALSGKRLM